MSTTRQLLHDAEHIIKLMNNKQLSIQDPVLEQQVTAFANAFSILAPIQHTKEAKELFRAIDVIGDLLPCIIQAVTLKQIEIHEACDGDGL